MDIVERLRVVLVLGLIDSPVERLRIRGPSCLDTNGLVERLRVAALLGSGGTEVARIALKHSGETEEPSDRARLKWRD